MGSITVIGSYDSAATQRAETLRKFQAFVRSADVRTDTEFQRILQETQAMLEISDREMGDALSVSRPTVNRWVNGRNLPYYAMRKPIVSWIVDQLTSRIRKLEAAVARQSAVLKAYSATSPTTYSASPRPDTVGTKIR